MIGEFRFQRFVCSGRVDLTVRIVLSESHEFLFSAEEQVDPEVHRFLISGIREALVESGQYPMAATLLSFDNSGEGNNWGAIKTVAKAATNNALGLDHLLPKAAAHET